MGELAAGGSGTFEKALMGCLRRRGAALKPGFLQAEGLEEAEMTDWGSDLERRLMEFERRYRGAQHLLGLESKHKEPQWFRLGLERASAGICLMLLKHRGKLAGLERFKALYEAQFADKSGAFRGAADFLLTWNIDRLMESLRGAYPEGGDAIVAWSTSSQTLEMTFTRGRAQRRTKLTFGRELTGTMNERFASTIALWRDLEHGIRQELAKAGCWPSDSDEQVAEEARALALMERWMGTLSERDRRTIQAHGARALERWKLGVRA